MVRVKICGITETDDAVTAAKLGASALGFVFYKKSPRYIGPYKAKKIIAALPPFVTPVGVFVDMKQGAVLEIADFCGIRTLQFHGSETPDYCRRFKDHQVIKAFRVGEGFSSELVKSYKVSAYLFDAHNEKGLGGTGETFDWELIRGVKSLGCPVILSGGLTPRNVADAINAVGPYAVDVSSGVEEKPGKKSERLLKDFFSRIL